MISVHLLTQGEVEEKLRRFGCQRVKSPVEGSSAWKTAWDFHFTLSEIPPDNMTPEFDVDDAIGEIERSRPTRN